MKTLRDIAPNDPDGLELVKKFFKVTSIVQEVLCLMDDEHFEAFLNSLKDFLDCFHPPYGDDD